MRKTILSKTIFIFLFTFLLVCNHISSQNVFYHKHQFKEFKDNPIGAIYQDNNGLIWVSTHQDIYSYNGENFQRYNIFPSDSTKIFMNFINNIFQDSNENIWISGERTLAKRTDDFFSQVIMPSENRFIFRPINDGQGYIWFSQLDSNKTKSNLYYYDIEKEEVQSQKIDIPNVGITTKNLFLAYIDLSKQYWWVHDTTNIYLENGQDKISLIGDISKVGGDNIWGIIQVSPNEYLIWTENGRIFNWSSRIGFKLFEEIGGITKYHNKLGGIKGITKDGKGHIWITAFDSIYQYNPNIKSPFNELESFKLDRVPSNVIYHDYHEGIWIPTLTGLVKVTPKDLFFNHFLSNESENRGVNDNNIFEIYEDSQNYLWLGLPDYGTLKLNKKEEKVAFIPKVNYQATRKVKHTPFSFCEDSQNQFWIGTISDGIFTLNRESNILTPFESKKKLNLFYREIIEDSNKNLWFVRQEGIDVVNPNTMEIFPVSIPLGEIEDSKDYHLFSIVEVKESIWFTGATRKLYKYNTKTQELKQFQVPSTYGSLCVVKDNYSPYLWVGTQGGGIVSYNLNNEEFLENYTIENGLASNIVYGILQDSEGLLWLSTPVGISRLNSKTDEIINYGIDDGLPLNRYNSGAYLKAKNGKFHFGGVNGMISFFPDSLKNYLNEIHTPIYISNITISELGLKGEQSYFFTKPSLEAQNFQLNSDKNELKLEFSSLDFRLPNKRKFQYRLIGKDSTWSNPSNTNFTIFQNLPYGNYIFELKGANNEGEWNPKISSISIDVNEPFRESLMAKILLAILLIAIAIFISIYSKKREEAKYKALKDENLKAQLIALNNQMNPHFTRNTLNGISGLIFKKDFHNAAIALNKFAKMNQMLLHDFKEILIPVKKEIEFLMLYLDLQKRNYGERFVFDFEENEIQEKTLFIPPMMLQPLLENSFRHAFSEDLKEWKLYVGFKLKDENIICILEDNGKGFNIISNNKKNMKANPKSISLDNIRKRLDLFKQYYNKDFRMKTLSPSSIERNSGTRIQIILPLLDSSYIK